MQTAVFSKPAGTTQSFTLDLVNDLSAGEIITAVSLVSVSPTTSPPLTVTLLSFSSTQIVYSISGGKEQVTYGVKIQVDTSLGNSLFPVFAVLIAAQDFSPFITDNPYAFQSLVDELPAGEAALGSAHFMLAPGSDATGGYIVWKLLDMESRIYSSGNAFDYNINVTSFRTQVTASAVIHCPSDIPPSLDTQKYQIRWELHLPGMEVIYLFETLKILGVSTVPMGAPDVVELVGDTATLSIIVPSLIDYVELSIYYSNNLVYSSGRLLDPKKTSTGWYYEHLFSTSSLTAGLDAYVVSWKYYQSSALVPSPTRITSSLYVLNPSMLNAIESCRQMVEKARSTLLGFPDVLFEPATVANWLIRGRDMFNAAGGIFTSFTMLNATGGVREFWLRYTEIAMLRSQALAEGEKAFDFQGQAISLTVNKAEYYQTLADNLQASVDNEVKPFKTALKTAGIDTGGDGNITNTTSRNLPRLGISVHPASQFGAYYRYNRF